MRNRLFHHLKNGQSSTLQSKLSSKSSRIWRCIFQRCMRIPRSESSIELPLSSSDERKKLVKYSSRRWWMQLLCAATPWGSLFVVAHRCQRRAALWWRLGSRTSEWLVEERKGHIQVEGRTRLLSVSAPYYHTFIGVHLGDKKWRLRIFLWFTC